ncbi:UNVERIFIED_CONTAM: hypothetical protein GTU68_063036 [Idotea baltica]|nr:hypothetical protein [Idotea baltica]
MSSIGKRIRVRGKVQGVWFRATTQRIAKDLGLKGWVMNQLDGSVLIEVFGAVNVIDRFVEQCKVGPRHAVVEEITCEDIPFVSVDSFEIKRRR